MPYFPNKAIHPGRIILRALEKEGMTQESLSERTGLTEKHISQIINGKASITIETALLLENVFGGTASFWINLEKNYQETKARLDRQELLKKEAELVAEYPYNELATLNYVEKIYDKLKKVINLWKFFGVNSLSYVLDTEPMAFRQSHTKGKLNPYALAAWLRCGELDSNKIEVGQFDKKKIKEIIPEIKKLTLLPDGFGKKLQELCASVGIAVVYTPYFKNTNISGSARWVGNKAVIQLNTRGGYSDMLWFTFFHELGHIYLHGKGKFIDFKETIKDDKEKEANKFSAEILIPSIEYERFLADKPVTLQKLESFAKSMDIGVDIIVGRMAKEKKVPWGKISHLRKKVIIKPD